MSHSVVDERAFQAAVTDAEQAVAEFDGACRWLAAARQGPMEPLAAEVWVFDQDLARVVLVRHRWRGWVQLEYERVPGTARQRFVPSQLAGGPLGPLSDQPRF